MLEIGFTSVKIVICVVTRGAYDQNYVNVVQACNSHVSNTQGPVKDLSGAQHDERETSHTSGRSLGVNNKMVHREWCRGPPF